MFSDVPRSNLHFLRHGGCHRNHTFNNISYVNPCTNLVWTGYNRYLCFCFSPMRPQCFVTSQNLTYIFWEMEASTEEKHLKKCKLHLGRFYLKNVMLRFGASPNFRGTYPKCSLHVWRCWLFGFFTKCKLHFGVFPPCQNGRDRVS